MGLREGATENTAVVSGLLSELVERGLDFSTPLFVHSRRRALARAGDDVERWVASGLVAAERQFRKAIGHKQIPLLLSAMTNAVSKKTIAKEAAVA
ncbi:MAG: hypothetical protein ACR2I2_04850 [Bryobacteraceae bacterium]